MQKNLKKHWDDSSRSYDMFVRKGFSNNKERRSWQKLFTDVLGKDSLNILDTGCGPGIVSMQLADLGHNMTSIDFSDKMLDTARKNASDNHLDIKFILADAQDLPFDDGLFDAVVSDYMLWTVPDPKKVMEEWFRVLRPEAILAYVDGDWWHDPKSTPFKRKMAHIGAFLDSPRKFIIDRKNIDSDPMEVWSKYANRPEVDIIMLKEAGFEDVRVIHNIQDLTLHGVRHLAHGSTEDHFMIVARKPYAGCNNTGPLADPQIVEKTDNILRRCENEYI
jgi:ubiquinone/menaquinone biosynthesis C-methylase UbiE